MFWTSLRNYLWSWKFLAHSVYVNTVQEKSLSRPAKNAQPTALKSRAAKGGSMQMEFLSSVENSWTEFSPSSKILLCGNTIWLHCATLKGYRFITLGGKCINTWLTGIKTCWLDSLYLVFRIFVFAHWGLSPSHPGYGISTFLFLIYDFARNR